MPLAGIAVRVERWPSTALRADWPLALEALRSTLSAAPDGSLLTLRE